MSNARRDWDRVVDKAIIAGTMKLVLTPYYLNRTNSFANINLSFFFSSFRLANPATEKQSDQERHRDVNF